MENKTAPYSSRQLDKPQPSQINDLKHRNSKVINYISKSKKSTLGSKISQKPKDLDQDIFSKTNGSVFNKSSLHSANGFKAGRNSETMKKFKNRLAFLKSNANSNAA